MKPFHFKQFSIEQDQCAMKVTLDACVLGASCKVENSHNILDIGTGTGLLSLMVAQRSSANIDAIEIDDSAAQQANANIQASPFANRIQLHHQSILGFHPKYQYDTIICNPPFFSDHLKGPDSKRNQARHNDNLSFLDLLNSVTRLLTPTGLAWFILPSKEYPGFIKIAETLDLTLHSSMTLSSRNEKQPHRIIFSLGQSHSKTLKSTSLVIHGDGREYSQDFKQLLHPYYLKL